LLDSLLQEISRMQSVVRKLVQAPLVRTLATTAPKKDVPAQYLKLKEKQKWFNVDNGKRVHERGSTDKALMMFTQSLLVVGGVLWLKTVYTMAFPNGFK